MAKETMHNSYYLNNVYNFDSLQTIQLGEVEAGGHVGEKELSYIPQ